MEKEGEAIVTANKRFYLGFIHLVNNTTFEEEHDAEQDNRTVEEGAGSSEEEEGRTRLPAGQNQSSEDDDEANHNAPTSLADVFRRNEEAKRNREQTGSGTGSQTIQPGNGKVSKREGV